jgi:hypothetical protein
MAPDCWGEGGDTGQLTQADGGLGGRSLTMERCVAFWGTDGSGHIPPCGALFESVTVWLPKGRGALVCILELVSNIGSR